MRIRPITEPGPEQGSGRIDGCHLGLLFMDQDGSWEAVRAEPDQTFSGESEQSLRSLPTGYWIVNLPFDDARPLLSHTRRTALIRAETFFPLSLDSLALDWAASDTQSRMVLAYLLDRAYGLGARVLHEASEDRPEAERTLRTATQASAPFRRHAHAFCHPEGGDGGFGSFLGDLFGEDLRSPVRLPDGMLRLTACLPPLTHALAVLSAPVPGPGDWQEAVPEEQRGESYTGLLKENAGLAVHGHYSMGSGGGGAAALWTRSVMTAGEFLYGAPGFVPERILVGPSFIRNPLPDLLGAVEAGAGAGARLSWSVGLCASVLLHSCFWRGRPADGMSVASAYVRAADRVRMAPVWDALAASGGIPLDARGGRVSFGVPPSGEAVQACARALWQQGAFLPFSSIAALAQAGLSGAPLPSGADGWGGGTADCLYASLVHKGQRRKLLEIEWAIDACTGAPERIGERVAAVVRAKE